MKKGGYTVSLVLSMLIFGSIGIFRRLLDLPSGFIAMARGVIGALFLLVFLLLSRKGVGKDGIKKNILPLAVSGALIGINWIFLFEAYRYTSVATATLCYYVSPVFVFFGSLIFFKEKFTLKKGMLALTSLVGMVLVSGVLENELNADEALGIAFALLAGLFYACVTLLSRKLDDVSRYDTALVELSFAAIAVAPYTIIAEDVSFVGFGIDSLFLLILVGILHTGVAYALYFGAASALPASKVAIYSYIDPICALLLSFVVLKEVPSSLGVIGAAMIILSAVCGDIDFKRVKNDK